MKPQISDLYHIILTAVIAGIVFKYWIYKRDELFKEGQKIIKACNVRAYYKILDAGVFFLFVKVKYKNRWRIERKTIGKLIKEIKIKKKSNHYINKC